MTRSNADLLALKAELTNDPSSLGLTTLAADDVANAGKLNLVRAAIQVERTAIPVSEIVMHVDRDEFIALPEPDRSWLVFMSNGLTVNPKTGGEVREGLLQLFNGASGTRANLLTILTEPGNRIEQLFRAGTLQVGGTVTESDIAQARAAT